MGELQLHKGGSLHRRTSVRRARRPRLRDYAAFQPGAANPMSYDDLKVIEARGFLRAIVGTGPAVATVDDAVASVKPLSRLMTRWSQVAGSASAPGTRSNPGLPGPSSLPKPPPIKP